jgi:hypothetical protein
MRKERKNIGVHILKLASLVSFCHGFAIMPQTRLNIRTQAMNNNDHLNMQLNPSDFDMISSLLSDVSDPTAAALDPSLEAEIFSDAAHVALDFASFWGKSSVSIRALAVIGRVFVMAADYIPDHKMFPEELIFQLVMLYVSFSGLVRSIPPVFRCKEMTMRDRKSFASIFLPAGMSWGQYSLLATTVLDWIDMTPGSVITTDETDNSADNHHLYWLYRGDIEIFANGEVVHKISGRSKLLIGDFGFFFQLSSNLKSDTYPKTTTKTGSKGATLLRIDVKKLDSMMRHDEKLDRVVRHMVLDAMRILIASMMASK